MLGWFKNTLHKSHGAVVAQNLIEMHAKTLWIDIDAHATATRLVAEAWDDNPDLFDGRYGQRPHKISVAAAALSRPFVLGIENREKLNLFAMCIGSILAELEKQGNRYPLSGLDHEILQAAGRHFEAYAEEFEASPLSQEIDSLLNQTD